ncbi:MAG: ankyrin repeat domain-containing protein [Caulobacteraceae bacterium]
METSEDRRETYRRFQQLTAAYRAGDLAAVKAALVWPEGFPNTPQPMELASGDWPLVTAINLSPLPFVRQLLDLGADPDYEAPDGFPSLFVALDSGRPDRGEILALLLQYGANPNQRGINDWTALHHAVARRDLAAIRLLLAYGADPHMKTRIDDLTSALDEASAGGFTEAVTAMEQAAGRS